MRKQNQTFTGVVAIVAALLLLLLGVSWAQDNNNQTSSDHSQNTQRQSSENVDTNGQPQNQSDIEKRIHNATTVLDEIMGTPDKAIPDKVMSDAKCIAVIPSMVRIAVGFGGSHGKGVATCRTAHGWSAPAPITITGGSWGLQLGGEAVDLVLVVMNQKGMDHLLSAKFKIGAEASGAAGPVGRDAGADTDWKLKSEMLTYSRARGIFAGIDLNGASITQDKDETRVLYGHMEPFPDILEGKVPAPPGTHAFLAAVAKYSRQSRGENTTPSGTR
jgi:lipid-binding SYLF domain-containing protein